MSDFKIQEGQIFVHKNLKHEGQQPTHKGSLMVLGVEYEIALWPSKSGKDGSFSGKVKVKQERTEATQRSATSGTFGNNAEDMSCDPGEVPF